MKESQLRRLIREEAKKVIQKEADMGEGVLYSYAGDVNIYDLTRSQDGGGHGPRMSGNNPLALEFRGERVELTPNEAEDLHNAVGTILKNHKRGK